MRITALETIQLAEFSNLVWVELHTDQGLTGIGETFRNPEATVAYLHETCAPYLLGKDPLQIERHAHALMAEVGNHFAGFPSRSIEVRGNSAVDLALWDLFGKAAGPAAPSAPGRSQPGKNPRSTTPAPAPPTTGSRAATTTRCWCVRRGAAARIRSTISRPSTSVRPSWRNRCSPTASRR